MIAAAQPRRADVATAARLFPLALTAVVACQALDALSTLAVLHLGGSELNPVMAALIGRQAAPVAFVAVKALAAVFLCTTLLWLRRTLPRSVPVATALAGFGCILYGVTLANNAAVLVTLLLRAH